MPQPATDTVESIYGVELSALKEILAEMDEPAYRADQILGWVYKRKVRSFDEMTNLSRALREKVASRFTFAGLEAISGERSGDITRKFLFRLRDRRLIECVLIPASPGLYGEASDRRTLCVSSQVGCAYDCKFCASGLAGFTRNLTAGEIVEQVYLAQEMCDERISNIVFMGMGEPLANLTNLITAIHILNAQWGMGIGARQMTVSTSGLAPQIRKLAEEPLQIRLAISLHGASDEVREKIMPINRKYPLERLFEALRYWKSKKKQKLTFEYILIEGVNDSLEQAALLARHAKSLSAKVNLIPYNIVEGLSWKRPSEARQEAFLNAVRKTGVTVTLRREKGHDIDAACGQLRLKEEIREGVISPAVISTRER